VTRDIQSACWPRSRLDQAVSALLPDHPIQLRAEAPADPAELAAWLDAVCRPRDLEVEEVMVRAHEIRSVLTYATPLLIEIDVEDEPVYLVVRASGRELLLVGPDGDMRISVERLDAILKEPLEARDREQVDRIVSTLQLPARRAQRTRDILFRHQLDRRRRSRIFQFRARHTAAARRMWSERRLGIRLLQLLAAYVAFNVVFLLSWWLLGRVALGGQTELGWVIGWTLLVLTLGPLTGASTWLEGALALDFGAWLKARLLHGSLYYEDDRLYRAGVGQLISRVFESASVERTGLGAGITVLFASVELILGCFVLWYGADVFVLLLALFLLLAVTVLRVRRHLRLTQDWVDSRLSLTQLTIEEMLGHRTRLVQEEQAEWHDREAIATDHYLSRSKNLDASAAFIRVLIPRLWMVLGLTSLAIGVWLGQHTPVQFAITLGAIVMIFRALRRLTGGIDQAATAVCAWKTIRDVYDASRSEPAAADLRGMSVESELAAETPVIELRGVSYQYPGRTQRIFSNFDFHVSDGERVLVEGPSGGGKSTLVQLLAGLRVPDHGLVLLGGLDHNTRGAEGWRRWVVAVPQFHNNYVFAGSFEFNLFMGRRWPAEPEDYELAQEILAELKLDELVARMPSGLLQPIGETGWQLSHGERSRLFIARALLQGTPVTILDESFGALDPETQASVMECVLARSRTIIAIDHP
jgi:ATP-binding cassette, subfamily B, bacterial